MGVAYGPFFAWNSSWPRDDGCGLSEDRGGGWNPGIRFTECTQINVVFGAHSVPLGGTCLPLLSKKGIFEITQNQKNVNKESDLGREGNLTSTRLMAGLGCVMYR